VGLAQNSIVLGFADGQGRSKYVAASAVFISVGGIAGGVLGGLLVQHLDMLQLHPIGPFQWNNWHVAFLLSMLARVPAIGALLHMPDPGARTVMGLLRYMGGGFYMNVTQRLFYPLRVFGWDRGNGKGHPRARARSGAATQNASGLGPSQTDNEQKNQVG
jgi:MFS family permease